MNRPEVRRQSLVEPGGTQREGAVPREEMWRTFNCGIGFVLVAAPDAVAALEAGLDGQALAVAERLAARLDLAFPVSPGFRPGSLQVSFGVGQAVGRGAVEDDPQITRSSRRTLSASVFNFPN